VATIVNLEEIPDDLAPGEYCCRIDESTTLADWRFRFVAPPRRHVPGSACCLVHITKENLDD
jgi:hypothetical protein